MDTARSFFAANPHDPEDQAKRRPELTLAAAIDRQLCGSVIRVLRECGLTTEGKHYRVKYGESTVTYVALVSLPLDLSIQLIAAVRGIYEQLQGRT